MDDDPKDLQLDKPQTGTLFKDALRTALTLHMLRPGKNKEHPDFVNKLTPLLWEENNVPKPKDLSEGDSTPRGEQGESTGGSAEDLSKSENPVPEREFKDGETVMCSAKKK